VFFSPSEDDYSEDEDDKAFPQYRFRVKTIGLHPERIEDSNTGLLAGIFTSLI